MADLSPTSLNALILFVDIIESSQYSAVLDIHEYAEKVIAFRTLFEKLAKIYFSEFTQEDKITKYCKINTVGDEGSIFYIDPDIEPSEIIFKSIKFAFELKTRWMLEYSKEKTYKKIQLGIGIHFGKVTIVLNKDNDSSIIDDIIGYPINYAKRIESCSRDGKYSRVFLSKDASFLAEGVTPIIFNKISMTAKGISDNEEMFEVQSVFFDEMPFKPYEFNHEKFIDFFIENLNNENIEFFREPWLKGLIASTIDSQALRKTDIQNDYFEKLSKFLWKNITENDPIILYLRAIECGRKNNFTMMFIMNQ